MKLQIPDSSGVPAVDVDRVNSKKKEKWVGTKSRREDFFAPQYLLQKKPLQLNFCVAAASQCEKKCHSCVKWVPSLWESKS